MFGSAVGRLQRDRTVGKCRAHLDDHASVARPHPVERLERSVYRAQVGHLGHAAELLGRDGLARGEHGRHRVVDPHVDRAEFGFGSRRRLRDLRGIGDVGRHGDHPGPHLHELLARCIEAVASTRKDGERRTGACEGARRRATDAGGCAGHDDDPRRRGTHHAPLVPGGYVHHTRPAADCSLRPAGIHPRRRVPDGDHQEVVRVQIATSTNRPATIRNPAFQGYLVLRIGFVVAPILFGTDE